MLPLPEDVLRAALKQDAPDADSESLTAAIGRSGGYLGQAKALLAEGVAVSPQTEGFVKSFAGRDSLGLTRVLVPMEKWKRDQAIPEWQIWLQLLEAALTCHIGKSASTPLVKQLSTNRSSRELIKAITVLQKVIEYAQGNVSVAAICGYLQWALR